MVMFPKDLNLKTSAVKFVFRKARLVKSNKMSMQGHSDTVLSKAPKVQFASRHALCCSCALARTKAPICNQNKLIYSEHTTGINPYTMEIYATCTNLPSAATHL